MSGNFCPECGQAIDREYRFCRECGAPLAEFFAPAAASPQADFRLSRGRGGNWVFVLVILVVLGILAALALPPRINRAISRKACISNMKTIEGAVELFLMEHGPQAVTLHRLINERYLRTEPKCPSGGVYTIRLGPPPPGGYPSVTIHCSIHQGIDDTRSGL